MSNGDSVPQDAFTRIRFHSKMHIYLSVYGYRLHENIKNIYWKCIFSKTLTKVDRNENTVFLLTCKRSKHISVSLVTQVSSDLKDFPLYSMNTKTKKRVAALLTMLNSLLAVYQVNCLLILLNTTSFQHRRVILSRATDSFLGAIRLSFVQWWLSFVQSLFNQSTIVFCAIIVQLLSFVQQSDTAIHCTMMIVLRTIVIRSYARHVGNKFHSIHVNYWHARNVFV